MGKYYPAASGASVAECVRVPHEEEPAMRKLTIPGATALIIALAASCALAQDTGATIVFRPDGMALYQGTGDAIAPEPATEPIIIGNFRLLGFVLPGESNLDYVGLVIPYRGALNQRMVNLETTWGSPQGLALLCEAVEPADPVGFRVRAWAHRRGARGSWLAMDLAPGHTRVGEMPAGVRNRRYLGEMHRWYVQTDMPTLYGDDDPRSEFSIVLKVGGWGSWWIKRIEIKAWPGTGGGD